MLHKIYTIKLIENGRLTWQVSEREKTLEDYRRGDAWNMIISIAVLSVVISKFIA